MTDIAAACLPQTEQGKVEPPTPEQLRQTIELAVLHCIQYKARAIEAAEKYNKDNENHAQS